MITSKDCQNLGKDYPLHRILEDIRLAAMNGATALTFDPIKFNMETRAGFVSMFKFPDSIYKTLEDLGYKVTKTEKTPMGKNKVTIVRVDWS